MQKGSESPLDKKRRMSLKGEQEEVVNLLTNFGSTLRVGGILFCYIQLLTAKENFFLFTTDTFLFMCVYVCVCSFTALQWSCNGNSGTDFFLSLSFFAWRRISFENSIYMIKDELLFSQRRRVSYFLPGIFMDSHS